jgi:hypothetical protein
MAVWGQTVIWEPVWPQGYLSDFEPVRILFHPLDQGDYAVFARLVIGSAGVTTEPYHAASVQLSLGTGRDVWSTAL